MRDNPANGPDSAPVDVEQLREAAGGDEQLLRELVELQLGQITENIGKLEAAIEAGSVDEVRRVTHTTIGGSATCGMTAVVAPLRELERMARAGRLDGATLVLGRVREEFERTRLFLQENLKS